MAGIAKPSLYEQMPPYELFLRLEEEFKKHVKHPAAKLGAAEVVAGERLFKKDIELIANEHRDAKSAPVVDLKGSEHKVADDSTTLVRLLKRSGQATQVAEVYVHHQGTVEVARELVALAQKSKDELVVAMAAPLKKEIAQLVEIQARVAAGGHPAFDLKVAAALRQCWVHQDNAFGYLAICCRSAGEAYNEVLAAQPTVKTSVRPHLSLSPPGAEGKPAKKPAKAKKGAAEKPAKADGKADTKADPKP